MTDNGGDGDTLHDPAVTNANYYTLFPWRNGTHKTNATQHTSLSSSIDRTDSGIATTRSYEAPNYSLGSYDSENFIIPTTTHRPVYQPYGGTIPQKPTTRTGTAHTTTAVPTATSSSSSSSSICQSANDDSTVALTGTTATLEQVVVVRWTIIASPMTAHSPGDGRGRLGAAGRRRRRASVAIDPFTRVRRAFATACRKST